MTDLTDPEEIAKQYRNARFDGRNPLFSDLPLGSIITDEMRTERLQNPLRFPYRKFSCFICGERLEFAGEHPNKSGLFLFYCPTCDANVEYWKLKP